MFTSQAGNKAVDSTQRQDIQNERYLNHSAMPASITQRAAAEQQTESPSGQYIVRDNRTSFLTLPAEIRLLIYESLFCHLTVTLRRRYQNPSEGPWNIIRTCRLCNIESLPIFYDLATIRLQHELFIHVLQSRIGAQNLAQVRSLIIGGYKGPVGGMLASRLPRSLKNLCFDWSSGRHFYYRIGRSGLSDSDIEGLLRLRRGLLDSSVKQIWSQNHDLRICLDAHVGTWPKVCGLISVLFHHERRRCPSHSGLIFFVGLIRGTTLRPDKGGTIEAESRGMVLGTDQADCGSVNGGVGLTWPLSLPLRRISQYSSRRTEPSIQNVPASPGTVALRTGAHFTISLPDTTEPTTYLHVSLRATPTGTTCSLIAISDPSPRKLRNHQPHQQQQQ